MTSGRYTLHTMMLAKLLPVSLALVWAMGVVGRASAPQGGVDPAKLPESEGKARLYRLCSDCHDIPQVVTKRRSVRQWRELAIDMIARGNPVPDAEVDALVDYCALQVGYVNVNKANEAELIKYGGFTAGEAAAIMAARAAGTLFETLDALKAVPGIDAKALDARSEKISFKDR
jgi:competence protein ComEA